MDRSQIVFGVSFALLFVFFYFFFSIVWNIFHALTVNIPAFVFFMLVFFVLMPAALIIAQRITRHFFPDNSV
ncbi:MAG TPA: hypothetical protein VK945_05785 [Planococcus sp. (in: firmicutes)]|nr:hypothetical protein [Planococcus sp. (in: firmicutes)]